MPSLPTTATICQVPPFPDVIPYYLPFGGISLFAGAPNLGKTALVVGMLRDILAGRPIFGQPSNIPPAVGFVNTDRGWDAGAGAWFKRAGIWVPYYSLVDDPSFDPRRLRRRQDRAAILFSFIDALNLPPGSFIVVDPISLFLGGNLLDYDACMVACLEIRAYLRTRQYTMLGTAHSAKLKADKRERYARMQDQILGTTALLGFSDTQMYLAGPHETGKAYHTFLWHPHGAIEEHHFLERDEQGLFMPWTGADSGNQQRVFSLLPEDGAPIAFRVIVELAEAFPLSQRTVQNCLDALIEGGKVEKVKRGYYRRVTIN